MKKIKLVALAVGMMVFAGCGNKVVENKGIVINSIKDVRESGKMMKCAYNLSNDGIRSVAYFSGNKYRVETEITGGIHKAVFDGDVLYLWSDGQKQGMKMTNECRNKLYMINQKNNKNNIAEDADVLNDREFDGAVNVKCEDVNNADFSIPSGINFVNQCEMMKRIP